MKWMVFILSMLLTGVVFGQTKVTFTGTSMIEDVQMDERNPTTNYASGKLDLCLDASDRNHSMIYMVGLGDTLAWGLRTPVDPCSLCFSISNAEALIDWVYLYPLTTWFDEGAATWNRSMGTTNWESGGASADSGDYWPHIYDSLDVDGNSLGAVYCFNLLPLLQEGYYGPYLMIPGTGGVNANDILGFNSTEDYGFDDPPSCTISYTTDTTFIGYLGSVFGEQDENRLVTADVCYTGTGIWLENPLDTQLVLDSVMWGVNANGATSGWSSVGLYNESDTTLWAITYKRDFNGATNHMIFTSATCSSGCSDTLGIGQKVLAVLGVDHGGTDITYASMSFLDPTGDLPDTVVLETGAPPKSEFNRASQSANDPGPFVRAFFHIWEGAGGAATSENLSGPDGHIILSGPDELWQLSGP